RRADKPTAVLPWFCRDQAPASGSACCRLATVRLDQPAFNRHRLNAEKLIAFNSLEQLSASDWTRVALCRQERDEGQQYRAAQSHHRNQLLLTRNSAAAPSSMSWSNSQVSGAKLYCSFSSAIASA